MHSTFVYSLKLAVLRGAGGKALATDHCETANSNSPWDYTLEGLLSERCLPLRFEGLFFGGGGVIIVSTGAKKSNFTF